jgi:BON domain-containing protein
MQRTKWIACASVLALALACNSQRRDAAVNQEVMASLSTEPQLQRDSVQVETQNGHVTLSGQVLTEDQRQLAQDRAQSVKGVKSVTNNLEIAVSSPPPSVPSVAPPAPSESPDTSEPAPAPAPDSQPESGGATE